MQKQNKHLLLSLLLIGAITFGAFTYSWVDDAITKNDVQAAAKMFGLEMTAPEIEQLLPGVEDYRSDYTANRKRTIDNTLPPSLVFNPIPAGYQLPDEQHPLVFRPAGGTQLPAQKDDLAWYNVRQLAELIRTRQISSVELTTFFLDRLKTYNDTLHFVITLTEERALEQARRADAEIAAGKYRGLLHGIPYGAKDLLAAKGYPTTWGATPFKDQVLDYDATVVQKLEEAGAVLCAKLTLGALAWGDVWFGERTRNPWNTETGSSGSSAGSASAVAAGCLPFAIGTETLGSIVSPSTTCGTTGLRPTFGRVSRHGAMALSWSMDKIGPIARTAEDCALVLEAIRGTDGLDFHMYDAPFNYNAQADIKRLRIGYDKAAFARDYGFKKQDSLSLLVLKEMGIELIPVELPEVPNLGMILSAEAAAAFDELTRSGVDDQLVRQVRNAWPNVFREARFIPAVEYIQANRLRTQLIYDMNNVFEQVDLFVHPSWASSSLRIANHTGHPCVVVPNGFQENGLPSSITFTGKLFEEGKILEVAQAFQEKTNFEEQHPF